MRRGVAAAGLAAVARASCGPWLPMESYPPGWVMATCRGYNRYCDPEACGAGAPGDDYCNEDLCVDWHTAGVRAPYAMLYWLLVAAAAGVFLAACRRCTCVKRAIGETGREAFEVLSFFVAFGAGGFGAIVWIIALMNRGDAAVDEYFESRGQPPPRYGHLAVFVAFPLFPIPFVLVHPWFHFYVREVGLCLCPWAFQGPAEPAEAPQRVGAADRWAPWLQPRHCETIDLRDATAVHKFDGRPDLRMAAAAWIDNIPPDQVEIGRFELPDGSTYTGQFMNGRPEGHGTLLWPPWEGCKYDGKWRDGRPHGRGVFSQPDEGRVVAEYDAGMWQQNAHAGTLLPPDCGTVDLRTATVVIGHDSGEPSRMEAARWFEAPPAAEGAAARAVTFELPDGSTYTGQFANGLAHGTGTFVWPDECRYDGGWRDGRQHGHGAFTKPSGERLWGRWACGMQQTD